MPLGNIERAGSLSAFDDCIDALTIHLCSLKKPSDISSNAIALLAEIKQEMHVFGTTEKLANEVSRSREQEDHHKNFSANLSGKERDLRHLKDYYREICETHERDVLRLSDLLRETQKRREALEVELPMKKKYIDKWEKSRCEQNSIRCEMKLKELKDVLMKFQTYEKNELSVHSQLQKFLHDEQTYKEKQVMCWRERRSQEMEIYKKEIERLTDKTQGARAALSIIKKEYAEKEEFVNSYLAEKEELLLQKRAREFASKCAIQIQSWWRGVMVRRKLGPYRHEEKKKKRPAKSHSK